MPIIEKPSNENKIDLSELLPDILVQYPSFIDEKCSDDVHVGSDVLNTQFTTARVTVIKDLLNNLYIIKEFPWYCANETFVDAVLSFQDILSKNVPIPKILKTKNDKFYIQDEKSKSFFFIQEFKTAHSWKGTHSQAFSLGTLLGNFHRHAQQTSNVAVPKETIFEVATGLLKLTASIDDPEWNAIKETFIKKTIDDFAITENESKKLGYYQILFPIHADYNYTNILFGEKGEVKGLLDFDNSLIDNPIHDIAQALIFMGCVTLKKGTPFFKMIGPLKENAPLMETFINAYCTTNQDLYDKVIHLLPLAARAVYLKIIVVGFLRRDFLANIFLSYYENINDVVEFIEDSVFKLKKL